MKMIDRWRPYAKCKDTVACSTSTVLLSLFGCYSAHVSEALLSLGAKVGMQQTGRITSSDCRQQWLQITYKM